MVHLDAKGAKKKEIFALPLFASHFSDIENIVQSVILILYVGNDY